MNLFGIKQYLIALFPLRDYRAGLSGGAAGRELQHRAIAAGGGNFGGPVYGVFPCLSQTKTHQSLFVYEHEDDSDDDDPHHGKPSAHSSSGWHTAWLLVHWWQ